MKQKSFFIILRKKALISGLFVLFFLSTTNVFAASNLIKLSQTNIFKPLNRQSTIALLNTLKNANVISKLTAPNPTPNPNPVYIHKNIMTLSNITLPKITLPVLNTNTINVPLMGASVISVGDYISSDYNNYILQPVLSLETATLSIIGDSLINLSKISFNIHVITLPRISLPKIAFNVPKINLPRITLPNTNEMASVIAANISVTTQNILKDISNIFSTFYNGYIALFTSLFTHARVEPSAITKTTPNAPVVSPTPVVPNVPPTTEVADTTNTTIDCGTSVAPKFDSPTTFENNSVLACLGKSALNCENAKGVLTDNFFPTIFEINKTQNSCNFKLSYAGDSTIKDITGKKLSLQYVSCPINIVKGMDDTNPSTVKFINADKTDLSKYGSQIYFYGALGLFIENNMDQNKIQSAGCSGDWINTVIASYNAKSK